MTDTIVNLLGQIPLVGIFIWFILEWTKRQEKSMMARDQAWRDFLREEREHRANAIARLAEEIKTVNTTVSRMDTTITKHDARADKYIDTRLIENANKK